MVADGQAGEDRHQSQHRAWVESLGGAAAALTDGQLKRWPPSSLWRRLRALSELPSEAKHVAAEIADRMYPHPDTDLCPRGRPPSKVQIAADASMGQEKVAKWWRYLEHNGWLEMTDRRTGGPPRVGSAARLRLTVPELYREDGVLEEHGKRSEGRVRHVRPLSDPPPEPGSHAEEAGPEEDPNLSRMQKRSDAKPLSHTEEVGREPLSHAEEVGPERPAKPGNLSRMQKSNLSRMQKSTAGAEGKADPLPTEQVELMSTEGVSTNGLPVGWSRSGELVECVAGDGLTLVRDEHGRPRHPSCDEPVEPREVGS